VINKRLGQQVGFLNPTLYHLAANPASVNVFTNINDGKNNQWSAGAANAAHSYSSGPGWDGCTGLGVINGHRLLAQLNEGMWSMDISSVREGNTPEEIVSLLRKAEDAATKERA